MESGTTAAPPRQAGPRRYPVLDCHPDLGADLDPTEFQRARSLVTSPIIEIPRGPWDPATAKRHAQHGRAFACLVVDGLLERSVRLGSHTATGLLGPRDLVGMRESAENAPGARTDFHACTPARIAVLDQRFTACLQRWPRMAERLNDSAMEQVGRASIQQAVSQLPRAEARLLALFWLLADRWGRVGQDGVRIDLALTHEALGRLVGAQRPTVSLALRDLADEGLLQRLPTGGWLLARSSLDRVAA